MKAILAANTVIAVVMSATVLDEFNISTNQGNFGGNALSIVDTPTDIPIGWVYRNNKLQPVLDTQELAVKFLTRYMDEFAQVKNYDTIITASLRAGYPGPFHEEGVKYATWMDSCWLACYGILTKVLTHQMEPPTEDELIALLPPKPEF